MHSKLYTVALIGTFLVILSGIGSLIATTLTMGNAVAAFGAIGVICLTTAFLSIIAAVTLEVVKK